MDAEVINGLSESNDATHVHKEAQDDGMMESLNPNPDTVGEDSVEQCSNQQDAQIPLGNQDDEHVEPSTDGAEKDELCISGTATGQPVVAAVPNDEDLTTTNSLRDEGKEVPDAEAETAVNSRPQATSAQSEAVIDSVDGKQSLPETNAALVDVDIEESSQDFSNSIKTSDEAVKSIDKETSSKPADCVPSQIPNPPVSPSPLVTWNHSGSNVNSRSTVDPVTLLVDFALPETNAKVKERGGVPHIEECLYGESNILESLKTNEEKRSISENFLLHDDRDYVLETGWWKTVIHLIDEPLIRKSADTGIPDQGSHRGVAWRVLLGLLPLDTQKWESALKSKRDLYRDFVKQYFCKADDCWNGEALRWKHQTKRKRSKKGTRNDDDNESGKSSTGLQSPVRRELSERGLDPQLLEKVMESINALRLDSDSSLSSAETADQRALKQVPTDDEYDDFIGNAKILDEIRKDIDRTFPDLKFFIDPENDLGQRRYGAMERILFVWTKCNQGVKYVQGMNEIVGTIYYVLANDWNVEWAQEAEADTYWLFHTLVTDIRDIFLPDMDKDSYGIQGRIRMMQILLQRHDPEVHNHLHKTGIEYPFFAIRWWTTLLAREFLLPDTIRLWDSLFASKAKDSFLCYVCITMLMMIRKRLLECDFSQGLQLLQDYPSIPMDALLASSKELYMVESEVAQLCRSRELTVPQALRSIEHLKHVIMAFGYPKGIATMTRAEKIEEASKKAAASARVASTKVKASAQVASSRVKESAKGWLGHASRLYRSYSDQIKEMRSTESAESDQPKSNKINELLVTMDDDDDDVYFSAVQGAQSGKYSYYSNT